MTLARTPAGGTMAAWRQHFPGNVRDVVMAPVTAQVSPPARVREDNWVYPGCPHSGPSLSLDSSGAAQVAWYTGRAGGAGIYLARSSGTGGFDPATTLLAGDRIPTAHPTVSALAGGGSVVAWDIDKGGAKNLLVAHVPSGATTVTPLIVPGTTGTTYPQLAALRNGAVALAWTQLSGDSLRIGLARIGGVR